MRLAKKRYVYLAVEKVGPDEEDGDQKKKPYGVKWEADSAGLERQRVHRTRQRGVWPFDAARRLLCRPGQREFPIVRQAAEHFMNYVHYEVWGPQELREPSAFTKHAAKQ